MNPHLGGAREGVADATPLTDPGDTRPVARATILLRMASSDDELRPGQGRDRPQQ